MRQRAARLVRSLTLVVLIVLTRTDGRMAAAVAQRNRTRTPPPPGLFEVHERSILDLETAQAEGRVTSRGLVDAYLGDSPPTIRRARASTRSWFSTPARAKTPMRSTGSATHWPSRTAARNTVLVKDNYDTAGMPTSVARWVSPRCSPRRTRSR